MALQGLCKGIEAGGEAATVDGHHETARAALLFARLIVVGCDVLLDALVEAALGGREFDELVLDAPVSNTGRDLPGLKVAAQEFAGMARDVPVHGRVRAHEAQCS